MQVPLADISMPIGVKELDDYVMPDGTYKSGAPFNAKAYRIVTGKQIGRASCRERVSSPV